MRKAHESLGFQQTPFPSKQVVHLIRRLQLSLQRQLKPAIVFFLSMFCTDHTKHSTAGQVLQGLCWETKHVSMCKNPPSCQPGARSLLASVSGCARTHPHTTLIWLVTGQDKGKSFCWVHLSMSAFILPRRPISKMLWRAVILTQPQPKQKDRLKASFPSWQSSHHTDTHKQFWFRGKYP